MIVRMTTECQLGGQVRNPQIELTGMKLPSPPKSFSTRMSSACIVGAHQIHPAVNLVCAVQMMMLMTAYEASDEVEVKAEGVRQRTRTFS